VEAAAEKALTEQQLAGLGISVVRNGHPPYAAGFGLADLESRRPVDADSLFHTASISKTFVATALLQLEAAGRVELEAPARRYLPFFPFASEGAAPITLRQMLSHSAGIPDVEDYQWDDPSFSQEAVDEYIRGLRGMEPIAAPGEEFHYSNIAFDTLGRIIGEVSGKSFEEYVREAILEPLGMDSSSFLYREFDRQRLTTGHLRSEDGEGAPVPHHVYPYNRIHAPSSTLASSPRDMNRWMKANLQRGRLEGVRILPEEAYERAWRRHTVIKDETWVGLAWFHTRYRGRELYYHSGGDTGFSGVCILVPEEELGVTVMTNTDKARVVSIALRIIDLYLE
jgi:CubicO group peptidase (beta-lactamase class C family)